MRRMATNDIKTMSIRDIVFFLIALAVFVLTAFVSRVVFAVLGFY